jgi:hypothetical protein
MADPVDVLVIIAGCAFVLSWPPLRKTRTYAFVGALATLFVGSNLLAEPGRFLLKASVIGLYVVVMLGFQRVLTGRSRADVDLDRAMRQISDDVNRELKNWAKLDQPRAIDSQAVVRQTIEVCQRAIERLDELNPTDNEWQEAANLMRRYLVAIQESADSRQAASEPSDSSVASLEAMRDEISRAWARALHPR